MPSTKVKRAIAAFEKAVRHKVLFPDNGITEHNYVKARAKLERLMENL